MNTEHLIYGTRAVIEALQSGKAIEKILLQKGLSNELYHQLRKAIQGTTIPLQFVPAEKLQRISAKNHQGVIAYLTEITYFQTETLYAELDY